MEGQRAEESTQSTIRYKARDSKEDFAIANGARRGVMQLRVVKSQADHELSPPLKCTSILPLPFNDHERMNLFGDFP
jgi:hypothetical protein